MNQSLKLETKHICTGTRVQLIKRKWVPQNHIAQIEKFCKKLYPKIFQIKLYPKIIVPQRKCLILTMARISADGTEEDDGCGYWKKNGRTNPYTCRDFPKISELVLSIVLVWKNSAASGTFITYLSPLALGDPFFGQDNSACWEYIVSNAWSMNCFESGLRTLPKSGHIQMQETKDTNHKCFEAVCVLWKSSSGGQSHRIILYCQYG